MMARKVAAVHRTRPRRTASVDWGPVVAVLLAAGLTLAIVTDGAIPGIWTKILLALTLPLNLLTALWLTRGPKAQS